MHVHYIAVFFQIKFARLRTRHRQELGQGLYLLDERAAGLLRQCKSLVQRVAYLVAHQGAVGRQVDMRASSGASASRSDRSSTATCTHASLAAKATTLCLRDSGSGISISASKLMSCGSITTNGTPSACAVARRTSSSPMMPMSIRERERGLSSTWRKASNCARVISPASTKNCPNTWSLPCIYCLVYTGLD